MADDGKPTDSAAGGSRKADTRPPYRLAGEMDPQSLLLMALLRQATADALAGDEAAEAWLERDGSAIAAGGLGANIAPVLERIGGRMAKGDAVEYISIEVPAEPRELRAAIRFLCAELPGLVKTGALWKITLTGAYPGAGVDGEVSRCSTVMQGKPSAR